MPPSITKTTTVVHDEEPLRHRRIHSTAGPTMDLNNNVEKQQQTVEDEQQQQSSKYQIEDINYLTPAPVQTKPDYSNWKAEIRWPDTIAQIFLHSGAIYGLYLLFSVRFYSLIWLLFLIVTSGFGITAGVHRLWSHNSYKAKWPLRVLLMFLFTISGQRDAYTWAHDHRVHHKYTETDADPHNCHRGFFFAHIGWVILTPHPEVVEKRKAIDMRDLEADAVVMFQKKYFEPLFFLCSIVYPVAVPWYFWGESLWAAFWVMFNLRFCVTLNIAFCINSVAHMFGSKPYDKRIKSVDNLPMAIAAFGEGWHNYHHVFPWDYKTGEMFDYKFNISTGFIDFFAKIGWAVDRKSVSPEMVQRRAARCGDGSHFLSDAFAHKDAVWGYGDRDIPKEDQRELHRMQD